MRETRRARNQSKLKMGASMAGIAGLGVVLIFTQFMTLGLLAISTAGGAMLGYGYRARKYPAITQAPDDAVALLPNGNSEEQSTKTW